VPEDQPVGIRRPTPGSKTVDSLAGVAAGSAPADEELAGAAGERCLGRGARMTVLSAGRKGSSFELIGDPPSRRDDHFLDWE
ncbi:hypothetical protein, partial [Mesorhizobium sp.]|uniref:hypothetical protein n=1 Tax=Mesorhizobium sp. TaxID=1871066 RepID=UPI0025C189E5